MHAILVALGSILGKVFASDLVRYLAFRAFMLSFAFVILPRVLKHVIAWMWDVMGDTVLSALPGASLDFTLTVTGLAAWIGVHMGIDTALNILMSSAITAFSINHLMKTVTPTP